MILNKKKHCYKIISKRTKVYNEFKIGIWIKNVLNRNQTKKEIV